MVPRENLQSSGSEQRTAELSKNHRPKASRHGELELDRACPVTLGDKHLITLAVGALATAPRYVNLASIILNIHQTELSERVRG